MEFIDFLKERESLLIEKVGENDWKENKLYLVDEIISMVTEWEAKKIAISNAKVPLENKIEIDVRHKKSIFMCLHMNSVVSIITDLNHQIEDIVNFGDDINSEENSYLLAQMKEGLEILLHYFHAVDSFYVRLAIKYNVKINWLMQDRSLMPKKTTENEM